MRAADPIVETRIERVVRCPVEVTAPMPAPIVTPADATIAAAEAVLRWIAARFAREEALAQRLRDAGAQCGG